MTTDVGGSWARLRRRWWWAAAVAALLVYPAIQLTPTPFRYVELPLEVYDVGAGGYFRPGQSLAVRSHRCNDTPWRAHFIQERRLESADGRVAIIMPELHSFLEPGCAERTLLHHVVPSETPPGRWRLVGNTRATSRLLRTVDVLWATEEFEVRTDRPLPGQQGTGGV